MLMLPSGSVIILRIARSGSTEAAYFYNANPSRAYSSVNLMLGLPHVVLAEAMIFYTKLDI